MNLQDYQIIDLTHELNDKTIGTTLIALPIKIKAGPEAPMRVVSLFR